MLSNGEGIYSRDRLSGTCWRFTRSCVPSSTGSMDYSSLLPPVQLKLLGQVVHASSVASSTATLANLSSSRASVELRIQKMEERLSNRRMVQTPQRKQGCSVLSVPPEQSPERRSPRPQAISKQYRMVR